MATIERNFTGMEDVFDAIKHDAFGGLVRTEIMGDRENFSLGGGGCSGLRACVSESSFILDGDFACAYCAQDLDELERLRGRKGIDWVAMSVLCNVCDDEAGFYVYMHVDEWLEGNGSFMFTIDECMSPTCGDQL